MAIYFDKIKGISKKTSEEENNAFTYIVFKSNGNPEVQISSDLQGKMTSIGRVMTEGMTKPKFTNQMLFENGFEIASGNTLTAAEGVLELKTAGSFAIRSGNENNSKLMYNAAANGNDSIRCFVPFYCDKQIEGQYFNVTSDIRAKENILPADFNALNLVKNVNIYTFNYKKDEDTERTVGIMAQDLLDKDKDNLSLVNNIEASGENDDFMSIKESKLVYILWKAIQEQQKTIEQLQKQIAVLEETIF